MMNSNIMGLLIGFICGLPYLIIKIRKQSTPSLNHFAEILFSCIGVVAGAETGFKVAIADDVYLGKLADQRITIIVGAITIIWVSISTLVQVYSPLFVKEKSDNADAKHDIKAPNTAA